MKLFGGILSMLFPLFLCFLFCLKGIESRHVAVTSKGLAVATSRDGQLVIQRQEQQQGESRVTLPSSVPNGFQDVVVSNEDFIFALSIRDRAICSYRANSNNNGLNLILCRRGFFAVAPLTKMSAQNGRLALAGGAGGITLYHYSSASGRLEPSPRINRSKLTTTNAQHSYTIQLYSPTSSTTYAVLGSLFKSNIGFGSIVLDLSSSSSPALMAEFPIPKNVALGHTFVEPPTNFPFVHCIYKNQYIYTAHGVMMVHTSPSSSTTARSSSTSTATIASPVGDNFLACSCAIQESNNRLVVGGVQRGKSLILEFDLASSPTKPSFIKSTTIAGGRIAAVDIQNNVIAYVATAAASPSSIGFLTPSPSSSPSPSPPSSFSFCFSATTTVQDVHGNHIALRDLKIGTKLKKASPLYNKNTQQDDDYDVVYGWAHLDRTVSAEFIEIYTTALSGRDKPLEITPNHLIYLQSSSTPVPASTLRVGQVLYGGQVITHISTRTRHDGVYAPLTTSGTLLVNQENISVSCFATLVPNQTHVYVGHWRLPISFHNAGQFWYTLRRWQCITTTTCTTSEDDWFTKLTFEVHDYFYHSFDNMMKQVLVLIVTAPFFIAFLMWNHFYYHATAGEMALGLSLLLFIVVQTLRRRRSAGKQQP